MSRVFLELECGADPDNAGRFYATLRWDNPRSEHGKAHESLSYINEPSIEHAIEGLLLENNLPPLLAQSLIEDISESVVAEPTYDEPTVPPPLTDEVK